MRFDFGKKTLGVEEQRSNADQGRGQSQIILPVKYDKSCQDQQN